MLKINALLCVTDNGVIYIYIYSGMGYTSVNETECVYCAVRIGSLNIIQVNFVLKDYVSCTKPVTDL
jgi:hypothetical protein